MRTKKLGIIQGSRGFGLTEVVVALGIASMLALGITQIMSNLNKATTGAQGSMDFQLAVAQLMGMFGSPTSCRSALFQTNQTMNPLNEDTVYNITLANPNTGGIPYETNRFFPGSTTLFINSLTAKASGDSPCDAPSAWQFVRYATNTATAGSPTIIYRYGWSCVARYDVTLRLENIQGGPPRYKDISAQGPNVVPLTTGTPNVGGRGSGAYEYTRTMTISVQLVDHAGSVADSPTPPSSTSVPRPTSSTTGWRIPKCSILGQGYQIRGIGRCFWCPRASDTDEGNVACAQGSNVTDSTTTSSTSSTSTTSTTSSTSSTSTTGDPTTTEAGTSETGPILEAPLESNNFYRYRGRLRLAVEEARILNQVFSAVSQAQALEQEPDTNGNSSTGGGTGDPPLPTSSPSPGVVPTTPTGAQWASSMYGDPIVCSAGWYQAGVRFWSVPMSPSPVPNFTSPPCYATGKYANCSSSTVINSTPPVDLKYMVYCCEVETN